MFALSMFFYLFNTIAIASAVCVVLVSNSVYGVLFLVLTFISVGCIFLLLGLELISIIFLLVYVGAILILFLFVVMMLEIPLGISYKKIYLSLNVVVLLVVGFYFVLAYASSFISPYSEFFRSSTRLNWVLAADQKLNLGVLGILYTKFAFVFILVGFVLLLAVIGSIALFVRTEPTFRVHVVSKQIEGNLKESVFYSI